MGKPVLDEALVLLVVEEVEVVEEVVELVELLELSVLLDSDGSEVSPLLVDSTGSGLLSVLIGVLEELCGTDELCESEVLSTYPGYSSGGMVDAEISAELTPKTSSEVEEVELLIVSGSGRLSVRLPGINIELTGRCASDGCPNPGVFSVSVMEDDVTGARITSGARKSSVP